MEIDLTRIILAVIALIGGILARYVIPWLRSVTDEKKRANIADIVETAVSAADRFMKTATGEERKAAVIDYLKKRGFVVYADDITNEMNQMIEAAVEELRIKQAASEGQ